MMLSKAGHRGKGMETGFAECGLDIVGCFPIADGPRFTAAKSWTRKELNVAS